MGKGKMTTVIIAGGKGKRLSHLTQDIPKPMIQIAGKPVLEYQIELLRQYGMTKIYILIGYLGHVIKEHFRDGEALGVNIRYFSESIPLGTAGCFKILENEIKNDFMVLYGDLILNMKVDNLIKFHKTKEASATLVVHPNDHPYDSDHVVMDDTLKIIDFLPKNQKPKYYANLVNAAVYVLSPSVFKYIPKNTPTDFIKDIFPKMLNSCERLYGYKTAEYIKDMGTVDRFEKINKDFSIGMIQETSKTFKPSAIFLDRDGTLIEDIDLLFEIKDLAPFPYSANALKMINDSKHLCFLVTNQPVVAKGLCDIEIVKKIHNKLETVVGKKNAYLNDIYFCPHHPDKGYPEENKEYKDDCNCRKPGIGMIEQARVEYNIDLETSWIIGDTTTDIQTGINAGVKTILVRTGKGGKDGKFKCKPDFVFENLYEAVNFILKSKDKYKAYAQKILEKYQKFRRNSPFIIIVGGQARSGKSIFVKLLQDCFRNEEIPTEILSLDNWIVNVSQRTNNMTIRERFKYDEIVRDINRFIEHGEIVIRKYVPHLRNSVDKQHCKINQFKCLIIEGVPALDVRELRDIANINIYVDINEVLRKDRFYSFYRWKGLIETEIDELYQKRVEDEVPFIQESKKYAAFIVEVTSDCDNYKNTLQS